MNHLACAAPIAIVFLSAASPSLVAQTRATPSRPATSVRACSLMPKEEVKKYLPWMSGLDAMPVEEEAIGTTGSSCNYPSVTIQVLLFSRQTIDAARKRGGLETVSGIGDEAYFYNNHNEYAELYVKVGGRMLTVQANVNGNMDSVKPAAVNLAKALVAKLR